MSKESPLLHQKPRIISIRGLFSCFLPILFFLLSFSLVVTKKRANVVYGTAYPLYSHKKPAVDIDSNLLIKESYAEPILATTYPWKQQYTLFSPITKEYFRCKGSSLNPPVPIYKEGKIVHNFFDCNGAISHSLPIRHGKEFIYPILIELLNHIQTSLKMAVVVTSGHRCPTHNSYIDSSIKNQFSKQLIGAEVHFYIQNLENKYESVIQVLEQFYRDHPRYSQKIDDYLPLKRYEKNHDTLVPAWMNKEIFIRFYMPNEGRNRDEMHHYGYFSLQVRFDRDRQVKVAVTPQESAIYRQT